MSLQPLKAKQALHGTGISRGQIDRPGQPPHPLGRLFFKEVRTHRLAPAQTPSPSQLEALCCSLVRLLFRHLSPFLVSLLRRSPERD
jgi:hypothetical protein